ncbi:MAG: AAA family ATPase, partial [Candidatus Binatia bacterium]
MGKTFLPRSCWTKADSMKIKSVRVQNFRSFEDETIDMDDYTCLVGANGSGKSNVLHALNVLFRELHTPGLESSSLCEEDFHRKNTKDPIIITVTFIDLNEEAQKDFAHYFRQGQLIVSAVADFDPDTRTAEIKQVGQRVAMKAFAPFFEAEGERKKVAELKAIYEKIKGTYSELLPAGTKEAMIESLHSYEASHPEACESIPSEDQFYGVSKGANLLEKHIQWVHVPAVKDASTEHIEGRNSVLGKLLARTVRAKIKFDDAIRGLRSEAQEKYEELLGQSQEALKEISQTLKSRLA